MAIFFYFTANSHQPSHSRAPNSETAEWFQTRFRGPGPVTRRCGFWGTDKRYLSGYPDPWPAYSGGAPWQAAGTLAIAWCAAASAESTTSKANSTSSSAKSNTGAPSTARSNPSAPAQRINNIVNYNAVKTNQNPGAVNRITASGAQPMTPNAQSQNGRGLRTNPVPSPSSANPNARYSGGRNVNPTGDKRIAAGFDANQKRYQANQPKPTATLSPTRAWPGQTRPTSAAIHPSTMAAATPSRPPAIAAPRSAPPPPPRSYATAASKSTAKSSNNKKP